MFSNVAKKCFKLRCVLYAVQFVTLHDTQYTPQLETHFTNIAEHLTTYFYKLSPQNRNFSKIRHRLPDVGPGGPKHVRAIMRYFNCIF